MMKKKIKAFLMAQVIMFLIALSVFSVSVMAAIPTFFGSLAAEGDAVQAMQYAEIEANIIKLLKYEDLSNNSVLSAAKLHTTRSTLNAISVSGWEDQVSIGAEKTMGDGTNKYKIAKINIYKKGDTIPRATLEVPLTSQGDLSKSGDISVNYNNLIVFGTTATAPANGVMYVTVNNTGSGGETYCYVNGKLVINNGINAGGGQKEWGPLFVKKGDIVSIDGTYGGATYIKFIPFK